MRASLAVMAILFASASLALASPADPPLAGLDALYPSLDALYQDLHRTPELSLHEEKTAAKLAAKLHSSGFAPDREPTIRTGVTALTVSALELLGKP